MMVEIARGESSCGTNRVNPTSYATGVYQIMPSSFEWYGCQGNIYNDVDNVLCAITIMKRDGYKPWEYFTDVIDK
jgi:SLT domain-containing protein